MSLKEKLANLSPKQKQKLRAKLQSQQTKPEKVKNDVRVALTPNQQRLFFLEQLHGPSDQYHIPFVIDVSGALDKSLIAKSVQALIARHRILKCKISSDENNNYQSIDESLPLDLQIISGDGSAQDNIDKFVTKPFDFKDGSIVRFGLCQRAEHEYTFIIVVHHIIFDGGSTKLLFDELIGLYQHFLYQTNTSHKNLPYDFFDYAHYVATTKFKIDEGFWQQKLAGAPNLHSLPLDYENARQNKGLAQEVLVNIPDKLVLQLKALARENQSTPNLLLASVFAAFLGRWGQSKDIVFGMPYSHRERAEFQEVLGFFVNNLVVRCDVEKFNCLYELLAHMKQQHLQNLEQAHTPFDTVVECINPERSKTHTPIFQICFNYQVTPASDISFAGLTFGAQVPPAGVAKFDLLMTVFESANEMAIEWKYDSALFSAETMAQIVKVFVNFLSEAVAHPEADFEQLDLFAFVRVPEKMRDMNIYKDDDLYTAFYQQVTALPNATAYCDDKISLSYSELSNEVLNLAAHLQYHHNVQAGETVAVCLSRGVDFVKSILAIMLLKATYVPLDIKAPTQRNEFIVSDSKARFVIDGTLLKSLNLADMLELKEQVIHSSMSPAYICYTSGTTGEPKGVVIEHSSVLSLVDSDFVPIGIQERILMCSNAAFDAMTFELWGPLLKGATICCYPNRFVSPDSLYEFISIQRITVAFLTTALFRVYSAWLEKEKQKCPLIHLLTGGEKASAIDFIQYYQNSNLSHAYNIYGPTESTTFTTIYPVNRNISKYSLVPIGRPLSDAMAVVLNAQGKIQPAGSIGELCIAGRGNAKGYLNNAKLTTQCFINLPIDNQTVRFYKTGDQVYQRPDGNYVYLGRNDSQVKIRGFRIELEEIAAVVRQYPGIENAVAHVINSQEDAQIACYYVATYADIDIDDLIKFTTQKLPEYMIPVHWIAQNKLPTNLNGKIDHTKLPSPSVDMVNPVKQLTDVRQIKLAAIWQTLLPNAVIDQDSNFFSLGGHSLMALKLLARIRVEFDANITLADIFSSPVLSSMSHKISQMSPAPSGIISQAKEGVAYPLSTAQARLWLVTQLQKSHAEFHMPNVMRLENISSLNKLENAIEVLVKRHTSLRTKFVVTSDKVEQVVLPKSEVKLVQESIVGYTEQQRKEKISALFEAAFDLLKGDVIHVTWLGDGPRSGYLVIVIHHIVCDGVSIEVLGQELIDAYNQPDVLVKRDVLQYVDYVLWHRQWLNPEKLKGSLNWWQEQLTDLPSEHGIPLDYRRPSQVDTRGHSVSIELPFDLQQSLVTLAKAHNTTVFTVVQSAFSLLVNLFSGQQDIIFGSPIANRDEPGLENAIGLFLNNATIRVQINDELKLSDFVRQVSEHMISVFAHQHVPFEQVVEQVNPSRNLGVHPLFQIMLNHQKRGEGRDFSSDDDLKLKIVGQNAGAAKYDLTVYVIETPKVLKITFNYQVALFKESRIERMLNEFVNILSNFSSSMHLSLTEIKQSTLHAPVKLCGEELIFGEPSLLSLIKQQCLGSKCDRVLISDDEQELTGATLWSNVESAAFDLVHNHQIKPGSVIALAGAKTTQYVVQLLAINIIGGVAVPLGQDVPQARLDSIIKNANIDCLIGTLQTPLRAIKHIPSLRTNLSEYTAEKPYKFGSKHPMYMVFTSGSTGVPKGVQGTESGLLNRCLWMAKRFPLSDESTAIHLTEMGYIRAMWELYLPLITGRKIHLTASNYFKDLTKFSDELNHHNVGQIVTAPSILKSMLSAAEPEVQSRFNQLKYWFVSGESFPYDIIQKLSNIIPDVTIVNLYGSTEVSSDVTYQIIEENTERHSVGNPIANTKIMVLDTNNQPLPQLVIGEVIVAGEGVALGYENHAMISGKTFFNDAELAASGLYRTGDIGYISTNNQLILRGRNDAQISIRGYRVEPGEIESAINKLAFVQQCEVLPIPHEKDGYRIVVFVASNAVWTKDNQSPEFSEYLAQAREDLAQNLPHYMLPSQFVIIDNIPLKANGKVDKNALTTLLSLENQTNEKTLPTTEVELSLSVIWQEILQRKVVSLDDVFFDIGGNSLLANQVINRIEQKFNISMPLKQIFTHPTLRWLARSIENSLFIDTITQQKTEVEDYEEFEL